MAAEIEAVVTAEGLDKATAKRLEAESGSRGLRLKAERVGFRGPWELNLPDIGELLAESETGHETVTWSFDARGLELLAQTLEWLADELPTLTFEAHRGELPIESLVTRDELLRIVRANRVGTRTRYRLMRP